jgi:hypothetical protein
MTGQLDGDLARTSLPLKNPHWKGQLDIEADVKEMRLRGCVQQQADVPRDIGNACKTPACVNRCPP